jgi:tRNA C32,U32 (ribose-2'-O)-methylase TrmJ
MEKDIQKKELERAKAELDSIMKNIGVLKQEIPEEEPPKLKDLRQRKANLTQELDDIEWEIKSMTITNGQLDDLMKMKV